MAGMIRTRFKATLRAALLLLSAACSPPIRAHSMYQAAVLLDFHGTSAQVELQLPVERLEAALSKRLSPENITQASAEITSYILSDFSVVVSGGARFRVEPAGLPYFSSIDGAPYVVARLGLTPPARASAEVLDLHCGVLLDRVPSQVVLVLVRTDWRTGTFANNPQLAAVLSGNNRSARIDRREGAWWIGFECLFALGMRHIAEGTDHLLFLLTLLLPAPLLIRNARWAGAAGVRRSLPRIGGIVTSFTIGHSATLAAGALDVIHITSRPIEVLIAISILIAAAHAVRPIFPGREAVLAGCFGLVHGMAFGATLGELGLGRWERVAGIFGFNLGIEAMQLIIVATALPSLILLSRTLLYPWIRTGGAVFAGAAAAAWIAQRVWDLPNPADAPVAALAQHGAWIAAGLTLLGLVAYSSRSLRASPISFSSATD